MAEAVEQPPTEPQAPEAPPVKYEKSTGKAIMADPEGGVYTIDPTKVADASAAGWRPVGEGEYESAKEGAWGTARAAVSGAARTVLPVNVYDPLAVEASRLAYGERGADLARQQLREDEQFHPTATLAGEVGGMVAGSLLIPGSGAGKATTATSVVGRAGQRVLAAAPEAMAIGAAAGISQQIHEDVLGNHEMVAQKYLASALKGSLMAVLIGGGLSAGLGHAGDKLAGLRGRAVESIERAAEGGPYRALGKVGDAARGKGVLGRLSDFAEEQAAKGAMPSASLAGSEMQKLGSTAEAQQARVRRIGRTLLDEGITTAGATKAVQAQRLTARAAEVGEELGALRKSFDRAAARPSVEAVMRRITEEVIEPLQGRAFTAAEQHAVGEAVSEITGRVGGKVADDGSTVLFKKAVFESFEDLHKLRRDLDAKLKWDKGIPPPTPALKELRAIRGILEDEFEEAAGRAAAELGEHTASKYQTAKALYADLKTAEKWATKGAARDAQNRAISLTDTIMAGAAVASGHPLGLLAPLANKAVRTYGNQVAATLADRATRVQSIQRAAQAFDDKLDAAVLSFFGKGKPPARLASAERVTPEAARALRDAARSPAQLADRVSSAVASTGLAEVAPQTARAMTSTLMRAGTWLGSKLPPEPPPRALAFGSTKPRPVGPRAQKEIDNAFRALDADAFVDDLARGRVDRQALEAMKFINPDAYDDIVGRLRRYGMENRPDLTRQQAVALSIITGTPLTPMMKPETIRGFQEAYAQEEPPHDPSAPGLTEKKQIGPGGPPPGRGQSTRAFASGTDKMEASNGT